MGFSKRLFITICLLFIMDTSFAGRYLNPEKVEDCHTDHDSIEVTCFFNGLWHVCPDPMDKETMKDLYQQYNSGRYLTFQKFSISESEYNDRENWNN
jgi:hypothetical protein